LHKELGNWEICDGRIVSVRAVATVDDSNQRDLDAEGEKRNWGATPEEEKIESEIFESLAHSFKIGTWDSDWRQRRKQILPARKI
jgi:hypothetical protein